MQNSEVHAVLDLVAQRPGLLGREIAARLGLTRQRVNSILYRDLAGKVQQDRQYRWWPAGAAPATGARPLPLGEAVTDSPVAHLCRYYLACLAREAVGEVTVFASSRHGLDYVELRELPVLTDATQEGIGRDIRGLIRGARQASASLSVYVGYPTMLRRHVARNGLAWFFVEPILLFPVHAADRLGGPGPHTIDTLPSINPAVMRRLGVVDGGGAGAIYEAIALAEELGLTAPPEELPEPDEVALRLPGVRPDWNWAEPIDPYVLSSEPALSKVDTEGIYNRGVLVVTESPPYTRGLETELRQLADIPPDQYGNTALGAWVTGSQTVPAPATDPGLLEVVPLNPEQRRAVLHGLSNPLTVVTGPPGTGKSQVVISLLANAAWRGQTALLASKNNKAVDVVVERTNGLSARPLLIRLGRDEHQQQLGIYIASLLAAATTPEDEARFRAAWSRVVADAAEMRELDAELDAVMTLRNTVERLARDTESYRAQLGEAHFGATRHLDENAVRGRSGQVVRALDAADRGRQGPLVRLLWPVIAPRRCRALACAAEALGEVIVPPAARPTMRTRGKDLPPWQEFATSLLGKAEMALAAHGHFRALRSLQAARPAEVIAPLRSDLADRIVDLSQEVWRAWLKLQPGRVTPQQRRDLAAFGAVLRLLLWWPRACRPAACGS